MPPVDKLEDTPQKIEEEKEIEDNEGSKDDLDPAESADAPRQAKFFRFRGPKRKSFVVKTSFFNDFDKAQGDFDDYDSIASTPTTPTPANTLRTTSAYTPKFAEWIPVIESFGDWVGGVQHKFPTKYTDVKPDFHVPIGLKESDNAVNSRDAFLEALKTEDPEDDIREENMEKREFLKEGKEPDFDKQEARDGGDDVGPLVDEGADALKPPLSPPESLYHGGPLLYRLPQFPESGSRGRGAFRPFNRGFRGVRGSFRGYQRGFPLQGIRGRGGRGGINPGFRGQPRFRGGGPFPGNFGIGQPPLGIQQLIPGNQPLLPGNLPGNQQLPFLGNERPPALEEDVSPPRPPPFDSLDGIHPGPPQFDNIVGSRPPSPFRHNELDDEYSDYDDLEPEKRAKPGKVPRPLHGEGDVKALDDPYVSKMYKNRNPQKVEPKKIPEDEWRPVITSKPKYKKTPPKGQISPPKTKSRDKTSPPRYIPKHVRDYPPDLKSTLYRENVEGNQNLGRQKPQKLSRPQTPRPKPKDKENDYDFSYGLEGPGLTFDDEGFPKLGEDTGPAFYRDEDYNNPQYDDNADYKDNYDDNYDDDQDYNGEKRSEFGSRKDRGSNERGRNLFNASVQRFDDYGFDEFDNPKRVRNYRNADPDYHDDENAQGRQKPQQKDFDYFGGFGFESDTPKQRPIPQNLPGPGRPGVDEYGFAHDEFVPPPPRQRKPQEDQDDGFFHDEESPSVPGRGYHRGGFRGRGRGGPYGGPPLFHQLPGPNNPYYDDVPNPTGLHGTGPFHGPPGPYDAPAGPGGPYGRGPPQGGSNFDEYDIDHDSKPNRPKQGEEDDYSDDYQQKRPAQSSDYDYEDDYGTGPNKGGPQEYSEYDFGEGPNRNNPLESEPFHENPDGDHDPLNQPPLFNHRGQRNHGGDDFEDFNLFDTGSEKYEQTEPLNYNNLNEGDQDHHDPPPDHDDAEYDNEPAHHIQGPQDFLEGTYKQHSGDLGHLNSHVEVQEPIEVEERPLPLPGEEEIILNSQAPLPGPGGRNSPVLGLPGPTVEYELPLSVYGIRGGGGRGGGYLRGRGGGFRGGYGGRGGNNPGYGPPPNLPLYSAGPQDNLPNLPYNLTPRGRGIGQFQGRGTFRGAGRGVRGNFAGGIRGAGLGVPSEDFEDFNQFRRDGDNQGQKVQSSSVAIKTVFNATTTTPKPALTAAPSSTLVPSTDLWSTAFPSHIEPVVALAIAGMDAVNTKKKTRIPKTKQDEKDNLTASIMKGIEEFEGKFESFGLKNTK